MAAKSSSHAQKTKTQPSKRALGANAKQTASGRRNSGKATASGPRVFDERTKRDVLGIVIIVISLVLFVVVALSPDAVVSSALSFGLRSVFGLGAFVLPFFLASIGVSYLLRFEYEWSPLRIALGLGLAFMAILVLLGLATPVEPPYEPSLFLSSENVMNHGGYVGSGIAFLGLSLVGRVVTTILMIGLIVVGLTIIGFSLSRLIEYLRQKEMERDLRNGSFEALPFAKAKRAHNTATAASTLESAQTAVLPSKASRGEKANDAVPSGSKRGRSKELAAQRTRSLRGKAEMINDSSTRPLEGLPDTERATTAPMTRKLGMKAPVAGNGEGVSSDALGADAALASQGKSKKSSRAGSRSKEAAGDAIIARDGYDLPSRSCIKATLKEKLASDKELSQTADCLQATLEDFNIMAKVVGWVAGPTVTLYKIDLPPGVRVSRITALTDDIALAMATSGVRIFAPIPGTNYVGIEVPNRDRQTVLLGDVLPAAERGSVLNMAIGKDVEGNQIVADLAKMPHLLIGGTTGSGKSVTVNSMIMTILMRATPDEVRFIMIDPKRVEFSLYNGIPHLYVPVVTEPKEAAGALSWGVAEMERRLKVFSKVGARNIVQYNQKVEKGELEDGGTKLPYIVIVIDELADLMMNVGKEVEFSISRIAQLARAAGIHLIVATQRPSANVVTGLIKANITNRIALNVASSIDSRVILDSPGAENLLSHGDLLFSKPEYPKPQRMQSCLVSEDEINAVVEHWKAQGEPEYHTEILKTNLITIGDSMPDGSGGGSGDDDPLIWEAADIVVSSGLGSTSNLQRRLKVGYARAGRIMDMLEEKGVVGPPNGAKPRDVLVDAMELETLKAFEAQDSAASDI